MINKPLNAPLQVDLNVTNQCNLFCKYCYAAANDLVKKENELTLDEINLLFKDFSKMGVLKVQIAGGEPLMRNDILDIIELASHYKFATLFSTNGVLLNNKIIFAIKKAKINLVAVSLEGPNALIHNKVKGSSCFNETISGIKSLRKNKIPVSVLMTLNAININYVFKTIKLVKELGIKLFAIQVLCPTGRTIQNINIIPKYKDFKNLFLKLTQAKKQNKLPLEVKINVTNESQIPWEYYFPLKEANQLEDLKVVWGIDSKYSKTNQISCVAGRTVCSIATNGDVLPCEMFLAQPQMSAGNIRNASFRKIWCESPLMKFFRKLKKGHLDKPCNKCKMRWCGGGCRAAAYFLTGSPTGADMHCIYAK